LTRFRHDRRKIGVHSARQLRSRLRCNGNGHVEISLPLRQNQLSSPIDDCGEDLVPLDSTGGGAGVAHDVCAQR
jgi:hypothetical protein